MRPIPEINLHPCGKHAFSPPTRSLLPERVLNDVIGWDIRTWSPCLDFWSPVLQGLNPAAARVLTIGERNGGISLWFALQGFRVICSDYGGPPPSVKEIHAKHGVGALITYADVDAFAMPYPDESLDIVACKSVIGGLKLKRGDASTRTFANQRLAVAEINRVLRPGGLFLGAENLAGTWVHQKARELAKQGRIGWRHLTAGEIESLFKGFAALEQRCYGFLGSRVAWLGIDHLTALLDAALCPLLPESWLYVSFIRARK